MKKIWFSLLFATILINSSGAFEATLFGGGRLDIPEAWVLDDSDPSVPTWYSPDRSGAAEALLWAPGTWESLDSFVENLKPEAAEGEIVAFPCWDGEVALADWTFKVAGQAFRGWFLFSIGSGPDIRISGIAVQEDFLERQAFILSILDSYIPTDDWRLSPGAVSTFLELTGETPSETASVPFLDGVLQWLQSPAGNQASQDVIEREALILSAYANVPELFYPAWERYYRLIYRDSYSRVLPLADALQAGPLPVDPANLRQTAEILLNWLQGFSYGSTSGFSDLLAPSAACAGQTGDCDSLSLALLILMDRYGVEGRLILSQQALHALAGFDLPGEGLRYVEGDQSWVVAELTSRLPLGVLPDRLTGVNDWFGISLLTLQ